MTYLFALVTVLFQGYVEGIFIFYFTERPCTIYEYVSDNFYKILYVFFILLN